MTPLTSVTAVPCRAVSFPHQESFGGRGAANLHAGFADPDLEERAPSPGSWGRPAPPVLGGKLGCKEPSELLTCSISR